ncbi:hypothetical protein ABID21_003494 [Pseudorhizobium tarimense]|uniref:Uncharacterized protein n=1 Tax=Pseudorhizobium tarimense TaxID=1079109 RepID=A0ABV2HA06_9HYPH|nr:hypothetical protein [Pseudorhizobium tarimense]MCJ8520617.1 hypothetical protein [Pseudorhizobium tarimense]
MSNPGYVGPGVWIRIRHRFGPRMMEWFYAAHMILVGYVLLLPMQTFNQPAFLAFRDLVPSEDVMGWFMLMIGLFRIVGLVVNGARKNVTPQIRQISAGIGCLIWSGISYGFASSDVVSTWLAVYPLFAFGELVNIHRAAHDQGEIRNGTTG